MSNFLLLKNGRVIERLANQNDARARAEELSEQSPLATFETARILRTVFFEFTPGTRAQRSEQSGNGGGGQ